ncbi:MAG: amino acid-binding protein [Deltaproteobacteria bacterium]|nr:amino acid-binding protein [Deltaproteobacteria bacterium]MBW2172030.1 amino acid-binding protein [Deltaproteobacteria bacterium]
MTVKQIVVGLKNKPGELSRIVGQLYENDVNIIAFWVGPEDKTASLRFIASDPKAAIAVLTGLGCKAKTKDVIAAQVPDHPGGLNSVLKLLHSANIDIVHMYPSLQTPEPILVLEVDKTKQAVKVLQSNWINLYDKKIYKL